MTKATIAGVALCLFMVQAAMADSAANEHVEVGCEAPKVEVTVEGHHFDVLAPGYPDSFTADVTVAPRSGWDLVKPTASELPLKMKGGSTAGYEVRRDPEDEGSGTIAFHNYYIKSNVDGGAKYIGVATGANVTYTAYRNKSTRASNWTVNGPTVAENKNNTPQIVFNRNWWQFPDWFIPSINTPKVGGYTIEAHDVDQELLTDDGEMAVFGADFHENASHGYGFDDYTSWQSYNASQAQDYYGPKNGRCMWPYASVRENHGGLSNLDIMSFGVNRTFDIVSDTERMEYSPETTAGSTPVGFNVDVAWYNLTGEASLSAKYNGTELARLRVVPFPLQTRKILVVYVNNATSPVVSLSTLNAIYKQSVTEFIQPIANGMQFTFVNPPNVWDAKDRERLKQTVMQDTTQGVDTEIARSDHVVFVISGTDSQNTSSITYLGWGERPGEFVWLYSSTSQSDVLSHEFGHNFGLTHTDDDQHNLMTSMISPGNRLRYEQWKKINKE